MSEAGFVLTHYFAIGLLALLSYLIGRRLTLRVRYSSALEQMSFCAALGLGFIAYLVFLLGLLGLLYPSVLWAALLACLLGCFQVWAGWLRSLPGAWGRLRNAKKVRLALIGVLIAIAVALSYPVWLLPLYPPTAFDAIFYHLTSAKVYIQNHGLVPTPYLRFVVFPQTNQMLFTLSLLLYDDILAHLAQFFMMLTLAAAMIAFGRRFFSLRMGWWSAALLLANPLVLWSGSVAYIDMGLMFYSAMTAYAFGVWLEVRERHWLILAGILCGLAVGVKYPALVFLCLLGLVAFYVGLRERRYAEPIIFVAVALLVVAPWFARNFYYTGNPVFPFFSDVFGAWFGYGQLNPEDYRELYNFKPEVGVDKNLRSLAMLPWHLAFHQDAFFDRPAFSSVYFYLLPLSLVVGVAVQRVRLLLALAFAFVLFWFFSIQYLRYLMPALPFLSLAAAASVDQFLRWPAFLRKGTDYRVITVLGCALLVYPGWLYVREAGRERGRLPVTAEQRVAYLSLHLPSYPAYARLNSLKGKEYTLYVMQDENMAYYVDGLYKGDWFGPARHARILPKLTDGQALYDELKSQGADYFLVNNSHKKVKLPGDAFFKSRFKPVYSQGGVLLFDLTDDPSQQKAGAQLVRNMSFEDLRGGWPHGWLRIGSPVVDASGEQSNSGAVAVRCMGADHVFYQFLSVTPGKTYLFSYAARGVEPGQKTSLRVNWSNTQGDILTTDMQVVEVKPEWKRYEARVTAPARATLGLVYAACHDGGSAWFDDFSFVEVNNEPASANQNH